ncbi:hypothetical protein LJR015_002795 [Peribacillus frigoritolerans]
MSRTVRRYRMNHLMPKQHVQNVVETPHLFEMVNKQYKLIVQVGNL